jgi:hypothetical protein
MSNLTTKDADGHPTYRDRHKHTDPHHHVGPCSAADRAGRASHPHRDSGERMTPNVEERIENRYAAKFRRKGMRPENARKKARRIAGAVVGKAARR